MIVRVILLAMLTVTGISSRTMWGVLGGFSTFIKINTIILGVSLAANAQLDAEGRFDPRELLMQKDYHLPMARPPPSQDPNMPTGFIVAFRDDTNDATEGNTSTTAEVVPSAVVHCVYQKGYAAYFPPSMESEIKSRGEVLFIEKDFVVRTRSYVDNRLAQLNIWSLDRVDQRDLPLDSRVSVNGGDGAGVDVYVLDSGVFERHSEFEGRATLGASFSNDGPDDRAGHGTHVSSTVAGRTFGLARKANIVGVKVIDDDGTGSGSQVIMGLE
ncbi:subtilisin-like serine protease, partial [Quaeritorhiza haematococci]